MSYIPANAKWYPADIVEQIVVEGDPRNIVHTNTVLVRADSPEDACAKANELGLRGQLSFENPEGKKVTITCRGLLDLTVIHDELEHGAELTYTEEIDMDETAIQPIRLSQGRTRRVRSPKAVPWTRLQFEGCHRSAAREVSKPELG